MDLKDPVVRDRLFTAARASYRALEPFRVLARSLVEEHAGSGYGRGTGERFETMANVMQQAVEAYTMSLVANRPRVLITTKYDSLRFFAQKFELALNNLIEEIRLEETLARWVLDAFFGVGVIKVHLADSAPVQLEDDTWMDPGVPFASNISLDNFVFDMSATVWHRVSFAADWYRVPLEDLKDSRYDQIAVAKNDPKATTHQNTESSRLENIGKGFEVDSDEFRPMVDVADFWIPEDGMIYTFLIDPFDPFRGLGEPIATMKWDGPEFGPYHLLGFGDVPENIMPTSPAAQLNALAKLTNNLLRKGARQARRQKDVVVFTPAGKPSAEKMKKAGDGDWVEVVDTKEIMPFRTGGFDPQNHNFLLGTIEMFDRMAGNLTAMLGLGAQADTVGQESLIHSAASSKEAKMQMKVIAATSRLMRDLGWMHWQDCVKVQRASLPIPNAPGYTVDATWTPGDRQGDFLDYNMSIDVFSMPYQNPAQRMQALLQILQTVFIPLGDMLAQQGGQIDLQEVAETLAKYGNAPELNQWIKFTNVPPDPAADNTPSSGVAPKPPTTTRNYTRTNIPSSSSQQGSADRLAYIKQQAFQAARQQGTQQKPAA